jgi:hypothetical protein
MGVSIILSHAIVLEYICDKTNNCARCIGGMNKLMRHIVGHSKNICLRAVRNQFLSVYFLAK